MGNMIETRGLVKRYKEVTALGGFDLDLPEGVVLGLLGPNGAGKTTLVSILSTLLLPDEGTATVAGVDVLRDPEKARTLIGLSGQFAAVDEYLTGFENLDMIGRLYHLGREDSRKRARELLERFDLVEAADRPVKTYSGGMKRRLDVAGALVAEPPVLFLDEPTTGLDPRSKLEVQDFIREMRAVHDSTILLCTHDLGEAESLAERVGILDRGRLLALEPAEELQARFGAETLEEAFFAATGRGFEDEEDELDAEERKALA